MRSGGPWNLRGLRPEARESARTAAQQSGVSVGEWLNSVIQPDDVRRDVTRDNGIRDHVIRDRVIRDQVIRDRVIRDDEPVRRAAFDAETEADVPRAPRRDDRESRRDRGSRRRSRNPDLNDPGARVNDAIRESKRIRQEARDAARREVRQEAQHEAHRTREELGQLHGRLDKLTHQIERLAHSHEESRRQPPSLEKSHRQAVQQRPLPQPVAAPRDAGALRLTGAPVKFRQAAVPAIEPAPAPVRKPPPPAPVGGLSIDQALAEIAARQRMLDGGAVPNIAPAAASDQSPVRQVARKVPARETFAALAREDPTGPVREALSVAAREVRTTAVSAPPAAASTSERLTVPVSSAPAAPAREASAAPVTEDLISPIREALNAAARDVQDFSVSEPHATLERDAQNILANEPLATPVREAPVEQPTAREAAIIGVPERTVDLTGLEDQLRQITARIEALRPSSDLESSVAGIRSDLAEIAQLITEALPRRAVESLEIEVRALAQRIDHSRQCGIDATALAGLERALNEVHEALRGLTPAESLVGFDDAIKALGQKLDLIVAKDDPAALQQLETAIGALRGIVSHVASNETLTKVAEDVRSLAAKVDGVANTSASGEAISALENRIETLSNALAASTEAGHAVPRELEKLFSGLIEKLEWVQLTHTDHAALAHLEDRIAMLVQRFDASDARLGHLEAVERGIADLLVHIEQIKGLAGGGAAGLAVVPDAIGRDVAEIKQSERRTQESLEAVQGTVEHVVDRLAMIESGIRESATRAAPALHKAMAADEIFQPEPSSLAEATPHEARVAVVEPANRAAAAAAAKRMPIDPDLPPDHPLEPGSAVGRSRQPPSAADRIAASEAAAGAAKPAVIADPGEKPNFIAAARRAAQAAAAAPSGRKGAATFEGGAGLLANSTPRSRKLIVAGAAALILIGGLQIASRWFESNPTPAPAPPEQTAPPVSASPAPDTAAPPAETSPPLQLPLPGAPPSAAPAAAPSPPPNAKSGAVVDPRPVRQLSMNDDAPLAAAFAAPSIDITGSVPHPSAKSTNTGAPVAPAPSPFGDKLPVGIGGPALRAAALSGDAAAAYEVAVRFADGRGVQQSNEAAALWLARAARLGLPPAQFRLGGLYEKGLGVKKDLTAARDLYLAAAKKGNAKAMHNLAVLYAEGIDGPADYANASHWFREAADHGVTDSQYNLGILYARGIGVAQNYAESYKWFALASIQGDNDAGKKRDDVASRLDPQSLAAAQLAVKTWTAEPQPDDATTVKTPPGGWDAIASPAMPAKPKPRAVGAKASDTKLD